MLFFRCCSVLILCYDHGTFIIVWFVCWNESIAYCCKLKKVTTFSSKVSIFLIENDFLAVNTNVIVEICMLLGISFVFSCSTVDKIEEKNISLFSGNIPSKM